MIQFRSGAMSLFVEVKKNPADLNCHYTPALSLTFHIHMKCSK